MKKAVATLLLSASICLAPEITWYGTAPYYVFERLDFQTEHAGHTIRVVAIRAQAAMAGDCDLDGDVDQADFDKLAVNFGRENIYHVHRWTSGDFDDDADVDMDDFNAMAMNYGVEDSGARVFWDAKAWVLE